MVKFSAGFALASGFSVASAQMASFNIRLRSFVFDQPFSQPIFVAHTAAINLFRETEPATPELRDVAENGANAGMLALLESEEVAPFVCGSFEADFGVDESGEPIIYLFGGGEFRATLEVDLSICPNPCFSMVGMIINTNDGFVGVDSLVLNLDGGVTMQPGGFDAGTEENTEDCSAIPGPACSVESGNAELDGGEGYVHVHRGVTGISEAGLDRGLHGWQNPIAEVYITAA